MNNNGMTSTLPPVPNGNTGEDANKTFYWTNNTSIETSYFNIHEIDGSVCDISIGNIYGVSVEPKVNDQIVYSEERKTRTFNVTEVTQSGVNVSTISTWTDDWERKEKQDDNNYDINITLNAVDFKEYSETWNQGYAELYDNRKVKDSNTFILNSTVTTNNNKPLGKIKVTLEFINEYCSPAHDTMMMHLFDGYNTQYSTGYQGHYEYQAKTYRGLLTAYNRLARTYKLYYKDSYTHTKKDLNNYDEEKIDNFTYVIKDFNESIDSSTHTCQNVLKRDMLTNGVGYLSRYLSLPLYPTSGQRYRFFFINGSVGKIHIGSVYHDNGNSSFQLTVTAINLTGGKGYVEFTSNNGYTRRYDSAPTYDGGDLRGLIFDSGNSQDDKKLWYDCGTAAHVSYYRHIYKCYAYIYIQNSNNDYEKKYIGEVDLSQLMLKKE